MVFEIQIQLDIEPFLPKPEVKPNVQLYPMKKRIVPNFKLCKIIAHLSKEQYDHMVVDGSKILEKHNHRRYGEVVTVYGISNADGYDNTDPLNEFDYAVLSVCISYFADGIEHITVAMIYRGMTGKESKGGKGKMTLEQRDAILSSIEKLMGTIIEIDETETNPALNYGKDRAPITCSAM